MVKIKNVFRAANAAEAPALLKWQAVSVSLSISGEDHLGTRAQDGTDGEVLVKTACCKPHWLLRLGLVTANPVMHVLFLEQLGSTVLSQEAVLSPRIGKADYFLDSDSGLWSLEKWPWCAWNEVICGHFCQQNGDRQGHQDCPLQNRRNWQVTGPWPKVSAYYRPGIPTTGLHGLFHKFKW